MRTGLDILALPSEVTELETREMAIYALQVNVATDIFTRLDMFHPEIDKVRSLILALKHSTMTFLDSDTLDEDLEEVIQEMEADSSASEGSTEQEELEPDPELLTACLRSEERFRSWEPDNLIQGRMKNSILKLEQKNTSR